MYSTMPFHENHKDKANSMVAAANYDKQSKP